MDAFQLDPCKKKTKKNPTIISFIINAVPLSLLPFRKETSVAGVITDVLFRHNHRKLVTAGVKGQQRHKVAGYPVFLCKTFSVTCPHDKFGRRG